ncbi:hypothetical protein GBA52_016274 [Prunus armeniaca]|nr:hypothetical protein GBA52_016274 [Prunus armeniaca]
MHYFLLQYCGCSFYSYMIYYGVVPLDILCFVCALTMLLRSESGGAGTRSRRGWFTGKIGLVAEG